jgi:hypothetical protein
MLRGSLPLVLGLLAVSCSPGRKELAVSRMERAYQAETSVVERKLASSSQCLKDLFNVPTLKEEVRQLERKFAGAPRVRGQWRHLDLSRLPVPQANFLQEFGNHIGDLSAPNAIDYSSCQDLPCIFNKIYGKDDHVAGYVHYLWYLKMGHMLSADNRVHAQFSATPGIWNQKKIPLADYLYNDRELYGLWRLTFKLKGPFLNLPRLREVQRVPRGERFENPDFAAACGLAYSVGHILMTDGCLTIFSNPDNGYLYSAMTHELGHHIDFEEGRKLRATYRSHQPDYLKVSKFELQEFVENGKTVRQWKTLPGVKLVTFYAGNNPQENFAETLTYYRLDFAPTKRKISEDHFNFVGENYFASRGFDADGLIQSWVDDYLTDFGKDAASQVIDCHKEMTARPSAFFKLTDFQSRALPSAVSCLGGRGEEVARNLRAQLMINEPEACTTLTTANQASWDKAVRARLAPFYDVHLKAIEGDPTYLARIEVFYEEFNNKTMAREALFACHGRADEAACYEEELRQSVFQRAMDIKLSGREVREFVELYRARYTMDQTLLEVRQIYRDYLSVHQQQYRQQAEGMWRSCHQNPNDQDPPRGNSFSIRDGYLVSSIFNCLNTQMTEKVRALIQEFAAGELKVNHPKEVSLLRGEVEELLVRNLQDLHTEEKNKERRRAETEQTKRGPGIRTALLANFDWVKDVIDQQKIQRDCVAAGIEQLNFRPLYHTPRELFTQYLESNVCQGISESAQFKAWLESSKGGFEARAAESMLERMHNLASAQARTCLQSFPMDTNLNRIRFKKQREECLTNEWPKLERQVLDDISKDPLVQKFNLSIDSLRTRLQSEGRRIQIRVIRDNFN